MRTASGCSGGSSSTSASTRRQVCRSAGLIPDTPEGYGWSVGDLRQCLACLLQLCLESCDTGGPLLPCSADHGLDGPGQLCVQLLGGAGDCRGGDRQAAAEPR